ncbi:NAD-P-binding protein [Stereum hirsutum FP-91666 SS1]|uniref:NAD-P-binding protein n=1 Tax=Stereum hirsutum (strain FP-91666) TaxID=721885 RepID=UPI000440E310|nr:NAD-P-binding protein [Stereum hirsutum FP-91666 SS1]EIM91414.1 NAD-P-binding protein [Stereum hirsutum FP-91666 SS1]
MSSASQNTAFIFSKSSSGNLQNGISRRTGPVPAPRAHEVLVRIHAVSLNYRDFAIVNGLYPLSIKDDVVLGSDLAGEVVALGEEVHEWKVGDKVIAAVDQRHLYGVPESNEVLGGHVDGVLQEYRVFKTTTLIPIPAHLSYEEGATLPATGCTAWNALFGGKPLMPGETVLLQGTGGVSMTGLMIASAAGAKTIITSSSDEKLEVSIPFSPKRLGATHTINYKTHPDWDKVVLELTGGRGAHHIFDNVGINEIEKCFNSVSYGGTIHCIGFLGGEPKVRPDVPMLTLIKGATLRGIYPGSKQILEEFVRFVETKGLRPHVDRVFPFEETPEAIKFLGKGQHSGKIVVKIV